MRVTSLLLSGVTWSCFFALSVGCVDGTAQDGPPASTGGGPLPGAGGATNPGAGGGTSFGGGATGAGATMGSGAAPGTAGSTGTAGGTGTAGSTGTGGTGSTGGGYMVSAADAQAAYDKFKTYFEACNDGSVRVKTNGSNETVSEGIAYGMLAAVAHGDQTNFDGLWKFYKDNSNGNGVMDWKINACTGQVLEANAATDAELDAAMALIQAECKWGGYASDATALLSAILAHEVTDAGSEKVLKPGDSWGGESCTNPSYFSPGYYRVFATFAPGQAATWNKLAEDSYVILGRVDNDSTGLVPDWSDAWGKAGGGDGCRNDKVHYTYDAARTPWRIATDYVWFNTAAAKTYLTTMTNWVGGNIYNVGDGYSLDGTMLSTYHNSVFTGGFAMASLAHSEEKTLEFMGAFLGVNPQGDDAYYQTALRAVYMLLPAGLFVAGC